MRVLDLIHKNEKIDNVRELGNMTFIKGLTVIPMDTAMEIMFNQAKGNAPKATLTFIEKDKKGAYP